MDSIWFDVSGRFWARRQRRAAESAFPAENPLMSAGGALVSNLDSISEVQGVSFASPEHGPFFSTT